MGMVCGSTTGPLKGSMNKSQPKRKAGKLLDNSANKFANQHLRVSTSEFLKAVGLPGTLSGPLLFYLDQQRHAPNVHGFQRRPVRSAKLAESSGLHHQADSPAQALCPN